MEVSNHGGVDVSLLCLWCVASHRFCVFITPRNGTNKQKRTERDQNVLFLAVFGSGKWKTPTGTQTARVGPSARVCRAPPLLQTRINMQIHGSRHWLISCLYCHTEEIQQVRQERGAFFSMSEQTTVWWHALPAAYVSCSVSDYGVIDQSSRNLLGNFKQLLSFQPLVGAVHHKPHPPTPPPYSTGLWKSPSNLACSNRWACEGKKYHFINPLKIKTRWKEHNPAVEKRTRVGFGEKDVRTVCTATLKCMVNINQQANTWRVTRAHLNWHDSSSWLDETLRWIYNRQPVMLPDANGTFYKQFQALVEQKDNWQPI